MPGTALKNKALQALSTGKELTAQDLVGDTNINLTAMIATQEETGGFDCVPYVIWITF